MMEQKREIYIENYEADEAAEPQHENWQERYLRLAADFENYRKRMNSERAEQTRNIRVEALRSILPVYDDFRHMLEHADDDENLLAGIGALEKSWQNWMQQNGIEPVGEIGAEFDYGKHDAVLQEVVEDPAMDGKITRIIKSGYRYEDTVLRHAQVAVGRYEGPAGGDENNQEQN
jgi:molecular chaperone GrpE